MVKYLPHISKSNNGQIVLIILLVMTVILTIGLSVVSRSVTDIKISQQSEESARALWVAQAGLEKAIKANAGLNESLSNVNYAVKRTNLGGGTEYVFPNKVESSSSVTLWLVSHKTTGEIDSSDPSKNFNGRLSFYWGDSSAPLGSDLTPALEATLVYFQGGSFLTKKFVFDPFSGRSTPTHFDPATAGSYSVLGQTFSFSSSQIDLSTFGTPYFLRLKLLFSSSVTPVGVIASGSLPDQGSCYVSEATVPESGVTRKLSQCQNWKINPGIFDYVLYSGGSIN